MSSFAELTEALRAMNNRWKTAKDEEIHGLLMELRNLCKAFEQELDATERPEARPLRSDSAKVKQLARELAEAVARLPNGVPVSGTACGSRHQRVRRRWWITWAVVASFGR